MSAPSSTFSVGVDVDSLWHYYRIHGLNEQSASDHAWSVGVPRFMALFDALEIPATFYCVAEDIERSETCLQRLQTLSSRGFELGNHSWHHPYALTTLDPMLAHEEILEGKRRLEAVTDQAVVGFRAPGYHTSSQVQKSLIASGHHYESSAFPCAPYYVAKALVMGGMRLFGRRSQSLLGSPMLLTAPRSPYLASPESPYRAWRGSDLPKTAGALPHFPISIWWGLPLIGTLFSLLGPRGSALLGRRVARTLEGKSRHLTIEFHAADLLSLLEDDLDPQLAVQPDLRRSVAQKRLAFESFLGALAHKAKPIRLDQHPHTLKHILTS